MFAGCFHDVFDCIPVGMENFAVDASADSDDRERFGRFDTVEALSEPFWRLGPTAVSSELRMADECVITNAVVVFFENGSGLAGADIDQFGPPFANDAASEACSIAALDIDCEADMHGLCLKDILARSFFQ